MGLSLIQSPCQLPKHLALHFSADKKIASESVNSTHANCKNIYGLTIRVTNKGSGENHRPRRTDIHWSVCWVKYKFKLNTGRASVSRLNILRSNSALFWCFTIEHYVASYWTQETAGFQNSVTWVC
jgi:hypothetical protein